MLKAIAAPSPTLTSLRIKILYTRTSPSTFFPIPKDLKPADSSPHPMNPWSDGPRAASFCRLLECAPAMQRFQSPLGISSMLRTRHFLPAAALDRNSNNNSCSCDTATATTTEVLFAEEDDDDDDDDDDDAFVFWCCSAGSWAPAQLPDLSLLRSVFSGMRLYGASSRTAWMRAACK